MAVKIRMKMMGRKHRPFFRICAVDSRNPRDGRVLEELGTYDPMVHDTDCPDAVEGRAHRVLAGRRRRSRRIKVRTLIKKYAPRAPTCRSAAGPARERLAHAAQVVPAAGTSPCMCPPSDDAVPAPEPRPRPKLPGVSDRRGTEPRRLSNICETSHMRFDVLTLFPECFPATWVRAC